MAPLSETALLQRALSLSGITLRQLASQLQSPLPGEAVARKGWIGQAVERYLGGEAGSKRGPDFVSLGIELKTLPLKADGKPAESTFVTAISPLSLHQERWETSACWAKLNRVLWVPVEGATDIPFLERRIGEAFLWSPSEAEVQILSQDWQELTTLMVLGRVAELSASMGEYLQVRPKAAHGESCRYAYNEEGQQILMLPRGFYLRTTLTGRMMQDRFDRRFI